MRGRGHWGLLGQGGLGTWGQGSEWARVATNGQMGAGASGYVSESPARMRTREEVSSPLRHSGCHEIMSRQIFGCAGDTSKT